ncbi:4355_t:CDS:10, partial [Diversispora eburnea]
LLQVPPKAKRFYIFIPKRIAKASEEFGLFIEEQRLFGRLVPRRDKTLTITAVWEAPVVLRRDKTHTFTDHRLCNKDVDNFWNEIEDECLNRQYTDEKKRLQLDQVKVARVMAQGTEGGVRNIMKNVNTELEEPIAHAIQPKKLKRKYDADEENLGINGSSDNINIESTELDPNDEINIKDNEISEFDPLSDLSDSESYVSETDSESELPPVQKYPNVDSPRDDWILPSGQSIRTIIKGPNILHKSHPSRLGIIRIGIKVRKPEWIKDEDWLYLNSSVEFPNFKLSSKTEELLTLLLETGSLTEYKQAIRKAKFDNDIDAEMEFVKMFFGGSSMIHPMLQCLMNTTDRITYNPGEIYLEASANQRLIRRKLKPDDDKPLGMKVDGIFHTPGDKGIEIGMIEISGGYLNSDTPRYIKDHVKGYWGCRDILNDTVKKYNRGDYKILRNLRTWFFHVHGQEVQVWGMDIPVSKIYRMFLISTFSLPVNWDEHYELVHALRILWNLGRGLDDSFKLLEEFKKSHRRNTALHSRTSLLKNYI